MATEGDSVGLDGEWRTETRVGGTPSFRSRPVGGIAAGVEDPGTGFPLPALFFLVTARVAGFFVFLLAPGRLPLDRLDPWTLTEEGEREMFPPKSTGSTTDAARRGCEGWEDCADDGPSTA